MMKELKISLIQANLHWENIISNLEMFSQEISALPQTDLIVLPEMFSTGFTMNTKACAEKMDGLAVKWMMEQAKKTNAVIAGSLIVDDEGKYYNRLIWMRPDGTYEMYNKRHLFTFAGEQNHYAAGDKNLIVDLHGWKVCPLICYDLRFPVWSRNKKQNPYDLLVYVANWPERRSHPWKTLLQARAMENVAYVVGLNRVGDDGNKIFHSGDSAVINYKGEVVSTIKSGVAQSETIKISYDELVEFRKVFPALNDGDEFKL